MAKPSMQEALVNLMVIMSASDREMRDEELARIGAIIRTLPVFRGFPQARTLAVAQDCQRLLAGETGLEDVLRLAAGALSPDLRETAYAVVVDIAAADDARTVPETRMLGIVRERLGIDPEIAATIERAAEIRHRTAVQ